MRPSHTPIPNPIKGLLFDFDGVLINSLPVMQLAFSAALQEIYPGKKLRHTPLFREYRKHLGMGFPQIMQQLGLSADMFQPFRRHSRILAPYVRLYDDTIELLDWARDKGLTMGIATGKDIERTLELLTQLEIQDYFPSVLASDTVSAPKPAPDMALHFTRDHDLSPESVLLIGDAAADIRCGRAAGCQTAAAGWGYTDKDSLLALQPDYLFETPQDALGQLRQLVVRQEYSG